MVGIVAAVSMIAAHMLSTGISYTLPTKVNGVGQQSMKFLGVAKFQISLSDVTYTLDFHVVFFISLGYS